MAGYIGNKAVGLNVTTGDILGDVGVGGDIDVDGTANLDVVDIDGAVDMASTLQLDGAITLGVAGTSNGFINSPSGIFVNIDSDNNQTDRFFDVRTNSTDGSGTLLFQVLETGAATIANGLTLTDGNLTVADGHGIDFAAANTGASTNAVLDDYEEGTYVPTITTQNGTVALNGSYNTLSYIKVGGKVTIQGRFRLGTCSSASGFATMTVPFQNKNGTEESDYANLSLVTYNVDYTGGTTTFAEVSPNNSYSTWLGQADNAGWSTINASGLSDGDIIYVTGTYFTSS